jgi:hypothetical protein
MKIKTVTTATVMTLTIGLLSPEVFAGDIPFDSDGSKSKGAIDAGGGTFMTAVIDGSGTMDVFKLKDVKVRDLTAGEVADPVNVPGDILRYVIVYQTNDTPNSICVWVKYEDHGGKELCAP